MGITFLKSEVWQYECLTKLQADFFQGWNMYNFMHEREMTKAEKGKLGQLKTGC